MGSGGKPSRGDFTRAGAKHDVAMVVPLLESYTIATEQIDCRPDFHVVRPRRRSEGKAADFKLAFDLGCRVSSAGVLSFGDLSLCHMPTVMGWDQAVKHHRNGVGVNHHLFSLDALLILFSICVQREHEKEYKNNERCDFASESDFHGSRVLC